VFHSCGSCSKERSICPTIRRIAHFSVINNPFKTPKYSKPAYSLV
jgi:hypothetical protein